MNSQMVYIDLDHSLAQVRADADKVYVKDPRVKGGGYYRTVKGGSNKRQKTKDRAKKALKTAGIVAGIGAAGLAGIAGVKALGRGGMNVASAIKEQQQRGEFIDRIANPDKPKYQKERQAAQKQEEWLNKQVEREERNRARGY